MASAHLAEEMGNLLVGVSQADAAPTSCTVVGLAGPLKVARSTLDTCADDSDVPVMAMHGLGAVAPSFNLTAANAHLSIAGDFMKKGATPMESAALSGMHAGYTIANRLLS